MNLGRPFYGWTIVGVLFLIGVTEAAVFQNLLSIFMKPMSHDFGWSRASVSGAIAFGSIGAGVVSPFVGPILDRHGPRMVAFGGILFLSTGLVGMMFMSSIWQLYVLFGLGRLIAVGVLRLVIAVSVSNWFIRLRGRAMGISWLGARFGGALLPALAQFLILAQGWRVTWCTLGLIVFLTAGIPSVIFLRRRPEDMGLFPDGISPAGDKASSVDSLKQNDRSGPSGDDLEFAWTKKQALRTRAFWMLTSMQTLINFMQAGINFHIFPFLTDHGLGEVTAVFVLSTIAVSAAVGSVGWGIIAEKFNVQRLIAWNLFVSGLIFLLLFGIVQFRLVGVLGTGTVFFLAVLHGLMQGGRFPMINITWPEFFGRRSIGSIFSFSSPFRLTANAIGPIFAALCFDLFGSYVLPFYIFGAFFFISGAISAVLQPPQFPPSSA